MASPHGQSSEFMVVGYCDFDFLSLTRLAISRTTSATKITVLRCWLCEASIKGVQRGECQQHQANPHPHLRRCFRPPLLAGFPEGNQILYAPQANLSRQPP
jgi:hypothetical protein